MRRTSSATSASSEGASPAGLYTRWQLADGARLHVSINGQTTSGGGGGGGSPKSPDFDPDDDLFGSAAWQKKKRAMKHAGGTRGEGDAKAVRRASDREGGGGSSTAGWMQTKLLRYTFRTFVKVRTCVRALSSSFLGRRRGEAGGRSSGSQAPSSRSLLSPFSTSVDGHLSIEALAQQTRLLCSSYVFHRLSLKGIMSKRVKATPYQCPVADDLFAAGQELERLYPRIYCDVSRRISMTMTSPQLVRRALTTVLEATFRTGVTWAKVVSMVAIAAAFAEECVVQGHPNFVEDIVMCVGHFVAMNLTDWLAAQGGWDAFPTAKEPDIVKIPDGSLMLFTVVLVIVGSLVVLLGLRVLADTST